MLKVFKYNFGQWQNVNTKIHRSTDLSMQHSHKLEVFLKLASKDIPPSVLHERRKIRVQIDQNMKVGTYHNTISSEAIISCLPEEPPDPLWY